MSNCGTQAIKPESLPLPVIVINGQPLDKTLFAQELQYHQGEDFYSAAHKAGHKTGTPPRRFAKIYADDA